MREDELACRQGARVGGFWLVRRRLKKRDSRSDLRRRAARPGDPVTLRRRAVRQKGGLRRNRRRVGGVPDVGRP
jgi:hypothetical protein